jgi:hypothetical protein
VGKSRVYGGEILHSVFGKTRGWAHHEPAMYGRKRATHAGRIELCVCSSLAIGTLETFSFHGGLLIHQRFFMAGVEFKTGVLQFCLSVEIQFPLRPGHLPSRITRNAEGISVLPARHH